MAEKEIFCPECACGHDAVKMIPRRVHHNGGDYDGYECPTDGRQIYIDSWGEIIEVSKSRYDIQAKIEYLTRFEEPVLKCANNHQPVEMSTVSFMDTAGLGTWYQCPSCLCRRFKTAEGIFNEGEGIMKINTVRYLEQLEQEAIEKKQLQEELEELQEEIERERENEETEKRRKQKKAEERLDEEKRKKEEFCARLLRNIELREKKEEQRKRRVKIAKEIAKGTIITIKRFFFWGFSLGLLGVFAIGASVMVCYIIVGESDTLRGFAGLVIILTLWTLNNWRKEWRANEKSQLEQANKRR